MKTKKLLTLKGRKILRQMRKTYDPKKARQVLEAMVSEGKITRAFK